MEVCNVSTHGFELVVGKDDDNAEAACDICANDSLEVLDDMAVFILFNLPAEPNLICLEMVITNGISLTFMMSADIVTSLYCCMIATGIEVLSRHTFGDGCCEVFPLRLPRSGLQIVSAFFMS